MQCCFIAGVHVIRVSGELGSGQFGTVSRGVWQTPAGAVDVAVKTLRDEATGEDKIKFLQEAAINGQFRHPNIVRLLGVVTLGEPVSWINGVSYTTVHVWYHLVFMDR